MGSSAERTLSLGGGCWGKQSLSRCKSSCWSGSGWRTAGHHERASFQYRAGWKLWPELEVNSTFFQNGKSTDDKQTFLTPGLGFGRVRLYRGLRFSMAGGLQIAVTQFHTYDPRWMLSVRFPF